MMIVRAFEGAADTQWYSSQRVTHLLRRLSPLSLAALFLLSNCTPKKSELVWDQNFYRIGSQSSPRATDLNGDGTLDIVIGAGKNEHQHSEQGILALDGQSGELLWQQEASDQVYGSATFCDITGDGVEDIVIGGRGPHLKALNGSTGEVIWAYQYQYKDDPILQYARFNFQNSVLIPDQNDDGIPELLAVNGGNSKAAPHSKEDRFPGVLMVLDTKTGQILAADTMPDGKESYTPPVCVIQPDTQEPVIIFGTGGETISGHLYAASLADLLARQLSNAQVIASEQGHGFIAPPSLVDISQDGYPDIVAISHGSTVFAIDGRSYETLWQQRIPSTESSNSFAVGYFTEDDIPDFFTFVSRGQWPHSTGSLQILLNGKDGSIAYRDSIGCTGFSSPVVYDLNGDGVDEAIISINEFDCSGGFTEVAPSAMENKLLVVNFQEGSVSPIDQMKGFKNIFSTPWIGDIDQDGYLDIVHCQYFSPSADLVAFMGMRVKRISTNVPVDQPPAWGRVYGFYRRRGVSFGSLTAKSP